MLEPLNSILKNRFKDSDLKKARLVEDIFQKWEEVSLKEFGEKIEGKTSSLRLRKGRLIIKVKNPLIACELQAKKNKLITLINEGFYNQPVKDIAFKV